jgi:hypothetical protein
LPTALAAQCGDPSDGFPLYRERILGESQLRQLLGFETFEVHAFLKQHEVPFYTLEDLEHDRNALDQLGL